MPIFIIDKHPLLREHLRMLLQHQMPFVKVVELDHFGLLSSAIEVHGLPRLISLELSFSDINGVSGIECLKTRYPNVNVIVLSELPAKIMEYPSLMAGATCFIEKSENSAEITRIFKKQLFDDEIKMSSIYYPTKRQVEVLRHLAKGLCNQSIAVAMGLSKNTVSAHLSRLFKLINVRNRTQAVNYARENNFLTPH
jgi:DNA-binding NarL/FixJ family response regulator